MSKDITIQFVDGAGKIRSLTGTLAAAAARFEESRVVVVKNATPAEPLRRIGAALLGPMRTDPGLRTTSDMFEWERAAGLPSYALFKAILGSSVAALMRAVFHMDSLLVMEHNLHRPRVQLPEAPDQGLPFHQDGGACGVAMVRGWFLLSPETCGEIAPNIEFLIGAPDTILPKEGNPDSKTYAWLELSHAERDRLLNECVRWQPSVELGDAIVFKGTVPHRTNFPPTAAAPRLSLETSIFPNKPDLYDYCVNNDPLGLLVVGNGSFDHIKRVRQ